MVAATVTKSSATAATLVAATVTKSATTAAALVAATVSEAATAAALVAASAATLIAATVTASVSEASAATTLVAATAATLVAATTASVAKLTLGTTATKAIIARTLGALKASNLIFNRVEFYLNALNQGTLQCSAHVGHTGLGHIKVAVGIFAVHSLNVVFSQSHRLAQEILEGEPAEALGCTHVDKEALLHGSVHIAGPLWSALFKIVAALSALLLGTNRGNFLLLHHVVLNQLVKLCRKKALDELSRG